MQWRVTNLDTPYFMMMRQSMRVNSITVVLVG